MTSIPATFELEAPGLSRPRARLRRDGRRTAQDWASDWRAEPPPVQLMLRCRLESGMECAAEAALPGRIAAGLDREAALRAVAAVAERWGGGAVAVPVTAAEVQEGRLIRAVAAMLDAGLTPERLELVLPEAALIGLDEGVVLTLAALRDLGIALTLDGFGAGVASLTVLRRLPLTGLKLARGVVRGLPEDGDDAAMARAGIAMAHAMGLVAIADGIETEAQRAFLAQCGCDEGQGALFGTAK
jgi:EAL domain-containing protein (putative c-di-GMP-specific phosphodiesterase class I)